MILQSKDTSRLTASAGGTTVNDPHDGCGRAPAARRAPRSAQRRSLHRDSSRLEPDERAPRRATPCDDPNLETEQPFCPRMRSPSPSTRLSTSSAVRREAIPRLRMLLETLRTTLPPSDASSTGWTTIQSSGNQRDGGGCASRRAIHCEAVMPLRPRLGLGSSLQSREELAQELHYTGGSNDSASMNVWRHRQVMNKVATNGGKVPADLKD